MAFIKTTQITSWSHSRLADYDKCPQLAKFKHVEKRKEPANAPMLNGTFVHALAQAYVSGETPEGREMITFPAEQQKAIIAATKKLPAQLKKFSKQLADLKKRTPQTEQMWVFTKAWIRTAWNDWAGAWLRIKMDAHYVRKETVGKVLYIIDYKTGKDKSQSSDNDEQLRLYVLGGLLMYPDVVKIVTSLWYTDYGTHRTKEFLVTPTSLAEEKAYWIKRTKPMLNDKRFAPKPGPHCTYCWFRKANDGPCKF